MKIETRPTEYETYGVYVDDKLVFNCNRAYNAHLIATILVDDEDYETSKKVGFKE